VGLHNLQLVEWMPSKMLALACNANMLIFWFMFTIKYTMGCPRDCYVGLDDLQLAGWLSSKVLTLGTNLAYELKLANSSLKAFMCKPSHGAISCAIMFGQLACIGLRCQCAASY